MFVFEVKRKNLKVELHISSVELETEMKDVFLVYTFIGEDLQMTSKGTCHISRHVKFSNMSWRRGRISSFPQSFERVQGSYFFKSLGTVTLISAIIRRVLFEIFMHHWNHFHCMG